MNLGFEFSRTAAKPKRESPDAPSQEPMRGSAASARRKPSADQKKVRRQMARQRKTAAEDANGEIICPSCGRSDFSETDPEFGGHENDWHCNYCGTEFDPDTDYISREASTPTKESTMSRQREVEILQAMAKADLPEQRRLAQELEDLRAARTAGIQNDRDLDMASTVIRDTLTPVAVHERHTAATDWITELPSATAAEYDHAMRTEATLWFRNVHEAVKADREEFGEQALGMARRHAGRYGEAAPEAAQVFLDTAARLHAQASEQNGNAESTVTDYETKADQDPLYAEDWEGEEAEAVHPPMPGAGEASNSISTPTARRKTAVSLTNVGIEGDHGVGTDPSGNRVKFRLSEKDKADLKAVLYSDLAVNFSGVDVEESDLIKDASRRIAAEGHPWMNDGLEGAVQAVIADISPQSTAEEVVTRLSKAFAENGGYQDSFDREHAFDLASKALGIDYNDIYDAWLDTGDTFGEATASRRIAARECQWTRVSEPGEDDGLTWWECSTHDKTEMGGETEPPSFPCEGWLDENANDRGPYTGSRRSASEGQTCSVCGDKIAKDPSGEDNSTYHHDNGEKHDHEAKPASKESTRRRRASLRKQAEGPVKGLAIYPDKTVREVTVNGLSDMQAIVLGLIEPIDLKDGVTMYANEEGRYQFTNADVNWIASDVASLGGRPEFMLRTPILGPVLMVGFDPESGESVDLPEAGRRWVQRVGREAGAKWASRKQAGPYTDEDFKDCGECGGSNWGSAGRCAHCNVRIKTKDTEHGWTATRKTASRPIYEIAADIRREWGPSNINYAAKPYLDAMRELQDMNSRFYEDDAKTILAYFLSNAKTFRGERATELKNEIKTLLGRKTSCDHKIAGRGCPSCGTPSRGNDFSISDAKNEDGEWIMSPEQIRAEMSVGETDVDDFYDDDFDRYSSKTAQGDGPTNTWPCQECGATVERWRGESDVACPNCNAQYNAGGQRLRDDWAGNPSNYDSEIGDLEGYEMQHHDDDRYASRRQADAQDGSADSSLTDVKVGDEDDRPMWPWELAQGDPATGQGAANVGSVPTPGAAGYPQPTASVLPSQGRIGDFRARVQAGLARMEKTASEGWVELARRVVENSQHEGGLDLFSASTMLQVHDALGADNQAKFAAMPLEQAHGIAFKIVNQSR